MFLTHPPYFPDLAPADYYQFKSINNHMNGENAWELLFFFTKKDKILKKEFKICPNDGKMFTKRSIHN